jgi:hypothetical protein
MPRKYHVDKIENSGTARSIAGNKNKITNRISLSCEKEFEKSGYINKNKNTTNPINPLLTKRVLIKSVERTVPKPMPNTF